MPEVPGFSADVALSALLEALDEGVLVFDEHAVCRAAGRRAAEILGLDAATVLGLTRAAVLARVGAAATDADALAPLATASERTVVDPIELLAPHARTIVWTSVPIAALPGARVDLLRDVTRERRAEAAAADLGRRLEIESTLDDLTGLTNRRRFEEDCLREHRRAQREWVSYAVARLDVDGMGAINAAHGFETGSELLKRIGEELKSARREYDVVARWKDDEFVLLLPRADVTAVRRVLQRTLDGVYEKVRALVPGVTVSTGVAVWTPPSAEGSADTLRRSTEAIEAARKKGPGHVYVDARTVDWKSDPGEG
jgi:diguanylate cyclase (GGDEF)-like protein